jgi:hypothetical protein
MKRFGLLAVLALVTLPLFAGCLGTGHKVESCSECVGVERCVWGEDEGSLYCADGCASNLNCAARFWCVPLDDQEASNYQLVWVCMPSEYYSNWSDGRVWRMSGDCENQCTDGMTCVVDDTASPDEYYCADDCTSDSRCLTDCCATTGYCAPWSFCH